MNAITTRLNKLHSVTRLLLSLGLATIVEVFAAQNQMQWLSALLVSWSAFSISMVSLSWITFFTVPDIDVYLDSRRQDESGAAIFAIVVISVCFSLTGILALRTNLPVHGSKALHEAISIISLASSWILLHTIFTLHYARLFYADDPSGNKPQLAGLSFPEEDKPDYLDFAYFSFVIGMTFQVSDVEITRRLLRKLVLAHSLISFVFNTVIVALTISVLSGSN
jgi:uncharacterized membrane protein